MPGPAPSVRGLGSLHEIGRRGLLPTFAAHARASEGPCFLLWTGPVPHVTVTDPDLIRDVLLHQDPRLVRDVSASRLMFRSSILALSGEPWRPRRTLMNPAYHRDQVRDMVAVIAEESAALVEEWGRRGATPFRPNRDLSRLMLRILGRVSFDEAFDHDPSMQRRLHRAMVTLSVEVTRRQFAPLPYWKVYRSAEVRVAERFLLSFVDDLVRRGMARRAALPRHTLLATLLDAHAEGRLSPAELRDEVLAIFFAGHETSATTASWVIAMLAKHPEVQARARVEVDAVLGRRRPTPDDLKSLEYLGRVVKETMRLYPSVPLTAFTAVSATELGGYAIPAGTKIVVSSYLTHRDGRLFPEPEMFDPERFEKKRAAGMHAFQYFPFLLGPHTCLGMHLATTELAVLTATLLQRCTLAPHVGALREDMRVSLHPAGLEIAVQPRLRAARLAAQAQEAP
jgi:cytochrome P450